MREQVDFSPAGGRGDADMENAGGMRWRRDGAAHQK
jgi:hypothetical protein